MAKKRRNRSKLIQKCKEKLGRRLEKKETSELLAFLDGWQHDHALIIQDELGMDRMRSYLLWTIKHSLTCMDVDEAEQWLKDHS